MALHIVLVEPEIPPNTGNISRTCAATGTVLHLVKPLGFSIDDRQLKRAGLDYWPFVKLILHDDLDSFLRDWGERRMFLATTKGVQSYTEVCYHDEDMLVFGKETKGLPAEFIRDRQADTIRIPMSRDTRLRSINLSNAVGIVLYEALRQLDFPKLK
ncbi:MAG: tRNA (uridine(34)/cytosine(34)/5-carboxymethylaminomethyluridine(34)-2'-O)-methyltransferase TrmL [Eubacteriales bacterium]|nr:tRNA (uridine(34)/cytosine(34)/5-carboxymethylaminomethyluridine(34)-2'-O)-methyltransferase TrmL [Eubacteriales bacterium]